MNRVLYMALGAEEWYGGCSGIGDGRIFSITELKKARNHLKYVVADSLPPIDLSFVEKLDAELDKTFGKDSVERPEIQRGPTDSKYQSLKSEEDFLDMVLSWMLENKYDEIGIFFG